MGTLVSLPHAKKKGETPGCGPGGLDPFFSCSPSVCDNPCGGSAAQPRSGFLPPTGDFCIGAWVGASLQLNGL